MNPPFTRPTNHEGIRDTASCSRRLKPPLNIKNECQKRRSKPLLVGGVADGNAGTSYFAELRRKLRRPVALAFVMPLSAMSGSSGKKCGASWRDAVPRHDVVTISSSGALEPLFSADTGHGGVSGSRRTACVQDEPDWCIARRGWFDPSPAPCLDRRGCIASDGTGKVRENFPIDSGGGIVPLTLGDTVYGNLQAPLPES